MNRKDGKSGYRKKGQTKGLSGGRSKEKERQQQPPDAFKAALRLLGYRDRSREELRERLILKGCEPEDVDRTVERLSELGLLDDLALARGLGRVACEYKLLGARGADAFLKKRGIGRSEREEALEDYRELEPARRLGARKLETLLRDPRLDRQTIRRRLSASLARRGFSPSTVREVVDGLLEEVDGRQENGNKENAGLDNHEEQ